MAKILLVDDEPKVLRALTAALELDHDVYSAQSGAEAKNSIKKEGPFDAILSDELMPGLKGHELLNWCRKNTPDSKRIMLTGLPITPELKAKFQDIEQVSIFSKPWDIGRIENLLSSIRVAPNIDNKTGSENIQAKRATTILILGDSSKYQKVYSQLEENSSATIIFSASLNEASINMVLEGQLAQVIIDVNDDFEGAQTLITQVCEQYPSTPVLITTIPKFASDFLKLESKIETVNILVKPFFYQRLLRHITGDIDRKA